MNFFILFILSLYNIGKNIPNGANAIIFPNKFITTIIKLILFYIYFVKKLVIVANGTILL